MRDRGPVQKVSGRSLEVYFRENNFSPYQETPVALNKDLDVLSHGTLASDPSLL